MGLRSERDEALHLLERIRRVIEDDEVSLAEARHRIGLLLAPWEAVTPEADLPVPDPVGELDEDGGSVA